MMTSLLLQACYEKSLHVRIRQLPSLKHTHRTHTNLAEATGFLAGYAAVRTYRRSATTRLLDGSAFFAFFPISLTGDAYLHAHTFATGFREAGLISAIMCVFGGAVAGLTIRTTLRMPDEEPTAASVEGLQKPPVPAGW